MESRIFACKYCNKEFPHCASKSRHERNSCKYRPDNCISERDMTILQSQLSELSSLVRDLSERLSVVEKNNKMIINNNFTQFNNTNCGNSSIQLNNFRLEDHSYIAKPFLDNCVKRMGQGVIDLVQARHFSHKHPENKNIKAKSHKDLSDGFLMVFQNGQWIHKNKKTVASDVFMRNCQVLDTHLYDNEEEMRLKLGRMFPTVEHFFDQMRQVGCKVDSKYIKDILALCKNDLELNRAPRFISD